MTQTITRKPIAMFVAAVCLTASLNTTTVAQDLELPKASKGTWYYNMGGHGAYSNFSSQDEFSFGVGVGGSWNVPTACGFNPSVSIQNYISDAERTLYGMGDAIMAALEGMVTGMVLDLIQDANPGLYDLMTKTLAQANAKFEVAVKNCREIQRDIENGDSPWKDFVTTSKSAKWSEASAEGDGDAIGTQREIDETGGDDGAPWIGGENHGGVDQPPINIVKDTLEVGYDIWDDGSSDTRMHKVFGSKEAVVEYAHEVLGETTIRTCVSCTKLETSVGLGLKPQHAEETESIAEDLATLVTGTDDFTAEDLDNISASGMGLSITAEVIDGLRDESRADKAIFVGRLSSEVALQRQVERMLMLRHLFKAAMQDPNIAANTKAVENIEKQLTRITEALDEILWERKVRREIASDTASRILSRKSARDSSSEHETYQPKRRASPLGSSEG